MTFGYLNKRTMITTRKVILPFSYRFDEISTIKPYSSEMSAFLKGF